MVRASNFAEFVAQLSADDAELQKDLKSAETATKSSAQKMQASLDGVSFSSNKGAEGLRSYAGAADKAGQSSQAATRGVTALGAAAAATGSRSLATGAQIAALVASTDELAVSLGLVGTVATTAIAVFGPIAITIAAVSVAVSIAKGKFDALGESITQIRETAEAALEPLRKEIELLRLRQQVRQGFRTQRSADLARISIETTSHTQQEFDLRVKIFELKKVEADLAAKAIENAKSLVGIQKGRALADRRFLEGLRRQRAEEAEILALEKERASLAVQQRQERRAAKESRLAVATQTAQQLLISIGAAKPSEFITSPVLRLLAQLGESVAGGQQDPSGSQGTFGLRQISGPSGALRAGQQIGAQTLNTAEQNKEINAKTLRVAEQVRDILGHLSRGTNPLASPLQTTGAP